MLSHQKKIQHLLLRAGFICAPTVIEAYRNLSIKDVFDTLWNDSANPEPLKSAGTMPDVERVKDMTQQERMEYFKKVGKESKALNVEWIDLMSSTKGVLREKMTLFWHGHFACHSVIPYFGQYLNNQLRQNALGKFSDLLMAVSKSPAMLQYLNNEQNRKESPNENFAREVMELFTMGRGNYTEDDIKNAARAYTGWRFNRNGEFVFAQHQHDDGIKTFLGQTGNFNGDDILNIILQQPATATFIVRKIYTWFVSGTIDEEICKSLADSFRKDYDVGKLMRNIFTSDWFYDEKNIGSHIKSPVELIVNLKRTIPIQTNNPDAPIFVERVLGQVLFNPPNVAGWKGGKNWIDSSSLMFRLSLPGFIFRQDIVNVQPKDDPEQIERRMYYSDKHPRPKTQKLFATTDWDSYINAFKDIKDEHLYDALSNYLLQSEEYGFKKETIMKYVSTDSRENYIKTLTIALMSVPEYQMC